MTMPAIGPRLRHFLIGKPLAAYAESGRDNILALRLGAALLVLLGHSVLAGRGTWPYDPIAVVYPQVRAHSVGLWIFFVVSGFLITLSYQRKPHLGRFLWARALRIWPALVLCAIGVAFVLGPLMTTVPLSEYFLPNRADSPYRYVLGSASVFEVKSRLPGLFPSGLLPFSVNASLWTIPVESTLYLCVAAAGVLRLLRAPWLLSVALLALGVVAIAWPMLTGPFPLQANLKTIVEGFFAAGAIACLLRHHVPISSGLMLLFAIAALISAPTRHALPFLWLATGYFVFWFAYVPRLPSMPHDVDLSYGTYLWGFPIQQALVARGIHDPAVLFVVTVPIVLALALLSWLLVEKPALRLKSLRFRAARPVGAPLEEAAR